MQLKNLWIDNYKNLKDFSLDFGEGNHLSILIGNNGSGKSNVLEAISGIFAEAYRGVSDVLDSDYTLDYELDGKNYKLEKKNGKRIYHYDEMKIPNGDIIHNLPSNVIALYSGEDLRLWENFYWQRYYEYLTSVYKTGFSGKMGMYYVNKYLWNISLLTLLLFRNDFSDVNSFLGSELGIHDDSDINFIEIDYSYENYDKNRNSILKAFVEKINPEGKYVCPYSLNELRKLISNSDSDFDAEPGEVFNMLMLAFMPKDLKLISGIHIILENGEAVQFFSEGEKKLILIKTILEFVADENSILLLDEPDANIHEERKRKLYDLLRNTPNRDVIMTTHSPIIAKLAAKNELIYLESKQGNVERIETEKLDLIRKLASNEWNIMKAGVFLNSEKPLVLFEGKSDVDFVKRAIELLKDEEPKYEKIDVDILCFNGTGNAKDFLKNIRTITETKKVIFFFDRDDGGKKGMASISEKSQDDETIVHFNDFVADDKNIRAVFLPYSQEISEGDFMIEDYFSNDLLESIINRISQLSHPVTRLPKLGEGIKKELASEFINFKKSDFEGFKPLLDKLLELLEIR
ncbi:MAG: AAA family ATPase [Treponema sp.]|nr:AAA family ATPase [Treponema sp.]